MDIFDTFQLTFSFFVLFFFLKSFFDEICIQFKNFDVLRFHSRFSRVIPVYSHLVAIIGAFMNIHSQYDIRTWCAAFDYIIKCIFRRLLTEFHQLTQP